MNKKTINEVSELWKSDKKQYVKQSTYAAYVIIIENHILPIFGNATDISNDDVQSFVISKLNDGLSQQTVHDILIVLKMIVRYGIRIGCDWKDEWEIRYPTVQKKKELEVLSIENQRKLMKYLQENFSFKNAGIYICLSCGLRIGEICALTWNDIDIERGVIHIRKTLERVYVFDETGRHTELMIGVPKTSNSIREIPISKNLMQTLRPLRKIVNPDYFILSNDEIPIEPRSYRNYYRSLSKKLGIPPMKFHGLRHSFATRCIESRCDYKTVSVLLGHANIGTTLNLYVHPDLTQKRKCIDKAFTFIK